MMVEERIGRTSLVPVAVIDDASSAVSAAEAMLRGGVDVIEITLRTEAALDAISLVARDCADMLVGAGTVLTLEACRQAVERGARFVVSPGFDGEIVHYCCTNGVAVLPGCVTPTEITAALRAGLSAVKFFPASVYGGVKAIKALSGPFPGVRFVPTGGIGLDNLAEYIIPEVLAVGGGWLCERSALRGGRFEEMTEQCRQSVRIVREARGGQRGEERL